MAYAVVRAVELGASVINISEVACAGSAAALGDDALGRAVRFAFERNVVVVVAAGNVGDAQACGTQNDNPRQPTMLASPARFSDYVISVGATEPDGRAAAFTLAGPWVSIAAPGTDITSLEPRGRGLANGQASREGISALAGTSFATPYVAGVAALVRAKYPQLSAAQVKARILGTARGAAATPSGALGAGIVDPVAALTAVLPDGAITSSTLDVTPDATIDPRPRTVALIAASLIVVVAAGFWLSRRVRPD